MIPKPSSTDHIQPWTRVVATETALQREAQQGAALVFGACMAVVGVGLRSAVATA